MLLVMTSLVSPDLSSVISGKSMLRLFWAHPNYVKPFHTLFPGTKCTNICLQLGHAASLTRSDRRDAAIKKTNRCPLWECASVNMSSCPGSKIGSHHTALKEWALGARSHRSLGLFTKGEDGVLLTAAFFHKCLDKVSQDKNK